MEEKLNERLLTAWLRLYAVVDDRRVVQGMTYNEAHVCNILYRGQLTAPERPLSASELCEETRMLKSQMNKIIVSLEKQGMIERERNGLDRRRYDLRLNPEKIGVFEKIHAETLGVIDTVLGEMGEESGRRTLEFLERASETFATKIDGSGQ